MAEVTKPLASILELPLEVRAEMAMKAAFQKMVREHARAGLPVILWRDGKVVEVPAKELLDQDSSSEAPQHDHSNFQ